MAKRIMGEHQFREFWKDLSDRNIVAVDKKGRYGHRYSVWLEDIVRRYWPELSAAIDREHKRIIADHKERRRQTTIFQQGGYR